MNKSQIPNLKIDDMDKDSEMNSIHSSISKSQSSLKKSMRKSQERNEMHPTTMPTERGLLNSQASERRSHLSDGEEDVRIKVDDSTRHEHSDRETKSFLKSMKVQSDRTGQDYLNLSGLGMKKHSSHAKS